MDLISAIKELTLGPAFFKSLLQEKRNVPRIVCNIKAHGRINDRVFKIRITDMNTKGVRVVSTEKLAAGSLFPLTVDTSKGPLADCAFRVATLQVQVAWCRRHSLGDRYNCGLMFVDNEKVLGDSWVYYIFSEVGIDTHHNLHARSSYRVQSEMPVTYLIEGNTVREGIVQNIGIGGILIQGSQEFCLNDMVELTIGPYGGQKCIRCRGRVVHVFPVEQSHQALAGIEFIDLTVQQFKAVGRMILAVMKDRARP